MVRCRRQYIGKQGGGGAAEQDSKTAPGRQAIWQPSVWEPMLRHDVQLDHLVPGLLLGHRHCGCLMSFAQAMRQMGV
jgi:hypothetical protein